MKHDHDSGGGDPVRASPLPLGATCDQRNAYLATEIGLPLIPSLNDRKTRGEERSLFSPTSPNLLGVDEGAGAKAVAVALGAELLAVAHLQQRDGRGNE